MSVGFDHPLVADYLTRLDAAAAGLPQGRRHELVAEIRAHVADALATVGDDEASVRGVLDRVGEPEDIVAAETGDPAPGAVPAPSRAPAPPAPVGRTPSPWGPLEISAVLGLTVGAVVVPLLGPLVGLVCAWASQRWTRREKIIATMWTVLAPVLIVLAGASLFIVRSSESVDQGPDVVQQGIVEQTEPAEPAPAPEVSP